MRKAVSRVLATGILLLVAAGCSHPLEVKNLRMYETAVRLAPAEDPLRIAVLPFNGGPDDVFYFNAIVRRLSLVPGWESFETDYVPRPGAEQPDLILSITPRATYRSSGWNFPINWPGFLFFLPAALGYVYHADIMTQIDVYDADRHLLAESRIPIAYDIRQTDSDRATVAGLSWLEVSLMAFIGGIYNAQTFDRDIIGALQNAVESNYSTYIQNDLQGKLTSAGRAVIAKREAEAAEAELPGVGAGEIDGEVDADSETPVEEGGGPAPSVD